MQNSSSKLTLSSLANEFLKAFYIRLAIFLSVSFKYLFNIFLLKIVKEYYHNDLLKSGKIFGKKRKQVRETIKVKWLPWKVLLHVAFFFANPIKYPFCILHFFLLIQCGGFFFTNLISYFDKSTIWILHWECSYQQQPKLWPCQPT